MTIARSRIDGSNPSIFKGLRNLQLAYFNNTAKFALMKSLVPTFVTRLVPNLVALVKNAFKTHIFMLKS